MKILLASLAAVGLALSTGAVLAQDMGAVPPDQSFDGVDTDRNGAVSWTEFSLMFPDITQEQFDQADANADGSLSLEEFDTLALSTGSINPPVAPAPASPGAGDINSLTHTQD